MDIIGVSRMKDGVEVDEFVIKCSRHEFYYKGQPPITHGCSDCWLCYFLGQLIQAGGDMQMNAEQLESAIHHAAELAEKGEFDFKPSYECKIEYEN